MKPLPLRIMTADFRLIDEISKYSSLQINRSWRGIGSLDLVINKNMKGAAHLRKGCIIFPYNNLNKAYIIRHREIALDSEGNSTENWIIKALHLKSWLSQRITIPPLGQARDELEDSAETVMLQLIKNNSIDPLDIKRKIKDLILSDDLKRGMNMEWGSRYKVLSEELEKIGMESKLGWNIDLDLRNKKYVVKVLEGKDKTFAQRDRPPAIFSPEFKTLKSLNYLESDLDYKNFAYVAGQGEGTDRRVIDIGDSEGLDRYELFVDARDVEEEIQQEEGDPIPRPVEDIEKDLLNRGNQKLTEHEQEVYLDGEVFNLDKLKYEKDWDLGDFVTIQNKEWGVTMNAQITEVKEIYEGGKFIVEPTFGNDRPDLISKIKQNMGNIDTEITR